MSDKDKHQDFNNMISNYATGAAAKTLTGGVAPLAYAFSSGLMRPKDLMRTNKAPQIRHQTKEMEELLATRGFHRVGSYDVGKGTATRFRSPKYKQQVIYDPNNPSIAMGGPNMSPYVKQKRVLKINPLTGKMARMPEGNPEFNWDRRMVHVGKGSLGKTSILAHELGHSLQSKATLKANILGKKLVGPTGFIAGAAGSLRSDDPEIQKRMDRVGMSAAGIGALGGLTTAATEFDASLKGYKMMRDAGKFKGLKGLRGISKRLSPFGGVPSYLAVSAAPAAAYYGARHLPEKIQELKSKLTGKTKE